MRILITGSDSYIGTRLEQWLRQWPQDYAATSVSMLDEQWRTVDFSGFDAVLHVAAIVHHKEDPEKWALYKKVNEQLPVEVAKQAANQGVGQFIFMSTMAVYGPDGDVRRELIIDERTPCEPRTLYGRSKLAAERELARLEGPDFAVALIRAPMVYGPGCRGNYTLLRKLVLRLRVVPRLDNQRSQLYVDNLCACLKLIMDERASGIFFPQNAEMASTTQMAAEIARLHGKRVWRSRLLGWFVRRMGNRVGSLRKAFGNLCYDPRLSENMAAGIVVGLEQSLRETEDRWEQ